MTVANQPPRREPLFDAGVRFRMAILAAWTVLGIGESINAYVTEDLRNGVASWSDAFVGNMPWWLTWALLTPVVFWLCRMVPLGRGRWRRGLAVHLPVSLLMAVVHILVVTVLYYVTNVRGELNGRGEIITLPMLTLSLMSSYVVMDWAMYWTVLMVWQTLHFHRESQLQATTAARLEARAAQLEASMRQARLDALRMELNPHFLFNSLNAVSGLVRRRENPAAVVMLARLGDLLRLTLSHDHSQEVPLDQELGFLEHYLGIEQVRFRDRLTIETDIAAETRRMLVPTMVLQPLVENAVRHGVARSTRPGRVVVRARSDGNALAIEIEDSGKGLSEGPRREGIGLSNTRARLQQLYGDAAELRLETLPGGGARATIVMPAHYAEEEMRVGFGA